MKTIQATLDTLCRNCDMKHFGSRDRCPMAKKMMCPDYRAAIAIYALEDKESLFQIPVELLASVIRQHGYTGELKKIETVII